jgi:eukaryotic-like serine/threonine-protein kinase
MGPTNDCAGSAAPTNGHRACATRVALRILRDTDGPGQAAPRCPSLLDRQASALSEIEPGALIGGKYTLLREAGMGGMGVVWVARNEATRAEVAVKFLPPGLGQSSAGIARLRGEARATASLSHRGVVRVLDLVEAPEHPPILVLELLHGQTLAEHIRVEGPLPAARAVRIALDLLSALAHVHGSGIVHRDIKPSNVVLSLDPDGHVTPKLLDFGVSKTLLDDPSFAIGREVLGTPGYMSPEQTIGDEIDARSDIFSMGILLYEMLGGSNPFAKATGAITSLGILPDDIVARLDHVSRALRSVVARAIRPEPADRFDSAVAMASALNEAARGGRVWSLRRRRLRFAGALLPMNTQTNNDETGRVEAFSDAVFAIAITLLGFALKVPARDVPSLGAALAAGWPSYLAFFTSFVTISIIWVNHHRLFTHIVRVDHALLLLNALLLMTVALVPFGTSVLSDHIVRADHQRAAAMLYSGEFIALTGAFNLVWRHAARHNRLLDSTVAARTIRRVNAEYGGGLLLYVVSFALALVSPWASVGADLLSVAFLALPVLSWSRAERLPGAERQGTRGGSRD